MEENYVIVTLCIILIIIIINRFVQRHKVVTSEAHFRIV